MSKSKKSKKSPAPFKPAEHVASAPMLRGDDQQPLIDAAIVEHVIGERVTSLYFARSFDRETSKQMGYDVDTVDVCITLENNVEYIARLVVASDALISRGEALAHLEADDPRFVQP